MKKSIAILLALVLVLSLGAACLAEPVQADQKSVDAQIALFCADLETIRQGETTGTWFYTVTDLDHNGRLELLSASLRGDGSTCEFRAWEISEDKKSFAECALGILIGEDFPCVLTESAATYYDNVTDTWHYLIDGNAALPLGQNSSARCILTMKSSKFICNLYGLRQEELVNGFSTITFKDASGKTVTPDEYKNAGISDLAEMEPGSVLFDWFDLSSSPEASRFSDSYAVFTGAKEPVRIYPAPAATATAPAAVSQETQQAPASSTLPATTADGYPIMEYSGPATQSQQVQQAQPSQQAQQAPASSTLPATTAEGYPIMEYSGAAAGGQTVFDYNPQQSAGNNPIVIMVSPTPYVKPHVDLMITRNPTDENRKVGSTARFVANANVQDSAEWTFVAPWGSTCSWQDFDSSFPGSPVSGVYGGVVSIENVTEDMDGWGAFCTFTYEAQTVTSTTGYIHIY